MQQQITIDIAPVAVDYSVPGTIFLDPTLLNAGEISWGVVQTEYANQVDFFLLDGEQDAIFNTALGGTVWCHSDDPGLQLAQYGCERFSSTLAWSYWQSPENCIQPSETGPITAGMTPDAFRALVTRELGPATSVDTATGAPLSLSTTTTHARLAHAVRVVPARGTQLLDNSTRLDNHRL